MASETPQRATREESRAIYGYLCTAFTSMNCTDGSFHLRAPRLHLSSLRGSAVYGFAQRYCTIASISARTALRARVYRHSILVTLQNTVRSSRSARIARGTTRAEKA